MNTRFFPINSPIVLTVLTALMLTLTSHAQSDNRSDHFPILGFDPVTGLPLTPPPPPPWKDPNWPDSDKKLAKVEFSHEALSDVAKNLRRQFDEAFDVLIPQQWENSEMQSGAETPGDFPITMELKNVAASEVFNAMNVLFEIENSPLRWELRMTGNRPMAILRVLADLAAKGQPSSPELPKRKVYFIGDFMRDDESHVELLDTMQSLGIKWRSPNGFKIHERAQLLIVSGTEEEIDFVQQVLVALREKARFEEEAKKSNSKLEEPKAP